MADHTKKYIAIDLAADGGKVVLASVTGGSLATETVHSFTLPAVSMWGQDYWDIYAAYAEVMKGLSKIGARKIAVESIGIDAWGPGVVCIAGDGLFLGPPRLCGEVLSGAVQAKFFKRMERRDLFETTGVNILDSHAALQMFGMRREKSVALEEAKRLLFIPEAIAYLLTDKKFSGLTSLSAAGILDRRTAKLSKDVLSACKVRPKRFPSVVKPGDKPGRLTEDVAQATGLDRIPVVAVSGSRIASAAAAVPYGVSAPAVASSADQSGSAFLMPGAVSVLGVETPAPMVNDQTFEMNFSSEIGAGGVNLLLKRIVGTDLLERCLEAWRAAGRAYSPEDVARMAREGAPTKAQLDPEDPALRSVPDAPAAISRYCSLRSMAAPVDDAATVRLIYESYAEKIGDTFVKLQSVTPFRIKTLYLIGEGIPSSLSSGTDINERMLCGVQDPVFCQLVADECAVPVITGPADAAVLGNVLAQAGLTRQALSSTFTPETYSPGL